MNPKHHIFYEVVLFYSAILKKKSFLFFRQIAKDNWKYNVY